MSSVSPLTLAFIEKRPSSVAQSLTAMETDDAAAFLETIPTRYAANTVSHMGAWSASGLLTRMNASASAAVLRELEYHTAAAILRMMAESDRLLLLDLLPKKLHRDLETSLSFPEDTVGAKMTTSIMVLNHDQTVADALAELKRSHRAKAEVVFVIDAARRLKGAVTAASLLHQSLASPLTEMMDTTVVPLSARARLGAIASLDAWDEYAQLPVLSRKKLVIGALSRKAAKQHGRTGAQVPGAPTSSIAVAIANAFFTSAIGLGQLLADVDQPLQPPKQQGGRS